jgi:heme exporter protein A
VAQNVPPILLAEQLCCSRDQLPLFQPVDFSLHAGELLLIEGDNGVGKTTLLRALLGLVHCEGTLHFQGTRNLGALKQNCRLLTHASGLKAELSVRQNWRFYAALAGAAAPDFAALSTRLGLGGFEDAPLSTLSAGQKKRAQFARLLLGKTHLWLLDEPFANLDSAGISVIESLMREFRAGGGAIIATSHGVLPFAATTQVLRLQAANVCCA